MSPDPTTPDELVTHLSLQFTLKQRRERAARRLALMPAWDEAWRRVLHAADYARADASAVQRNGETGNATCERPTQE